MTAAAEITVTEIADRLAKRALDVCRTLLPAGKKDGPEYRVGDVCNSPGKSLAVHLRGTKAGVWSDFATGENGDLIDLVQVVHGTEKAGAVAWAKTFLGIANDNRPPTSSNRRFALDIYEKTHDANGTEAEAYLRYRGINRPTPLSLRFHPNLKQPDTGLEFPTMVAGVQALDGQVIAIHRTFLQPGGRGKAVVNKPTMLLASPEDGAVRLAPAEKALGLAEGIETGLSAQQLFEIPVWAALSCTRFTDVAIPADVIELQVFADNGGPGRETAKKAAEHWSAAGKRVVIRRPPDAFGDWNDALPHWNERPIGEWEY